MLVGFLCLQHGLVGFTVPGTVGVVLSIQGLSERLTSGQSWFWSWWPGISRKLELQILNLQHAPSLQLIDQGNLWERDCELMIVQSVSGTFNIARNVTCGQSCHFLRVKFRLDTSGGQLYTTTNLCSSCSFSDKDESHTKWYTTNSSQITKVLSKCQLQRHLPVIMYNH